MRAILGCLHGAGRGQGIRSPPLSRHSPSARDPGTPRRTSCCPSGLSKRPSTPAPHGSGVACSWRDCTIRKQRSGSGLKASIRSPGSAIRSIAPTADRRGTRPRPTLGAHTGLHRPPYPPTSLALVFGGSYKEVAPVSPDTHTRQPVTAPPYRRPRSDPRGVTMRSDRPPPPDRLLAETVTVALRISCHAMATG